MVGVITGFEFNKVGINLLLTSGKFHAKSGFIIGGNIDAPLENFPLIIRASSRANIVQKNIEGATGWIDLGLSIGYEF